MMTASINQFLALITLFGAAVGVASFFAAMKIKGEISLEVSNQIWGGDNPPEMLMG